MIELCFHHGLLEGSWRFPKETSRSCKTSGFRPAIGGGLAGLVSGFFLSRIPEATAILQDQAAALSSLSAPRATIHNASSANGRCNAFASSQGARIHTSRSSSVVRITGIALG